MTVSHAQDKASVESFSTVLIAPCGMNCALCAAHLRDKKPCAGCLAESTAKASHCFTCRFKICEEMAALEHKYCFECARFPCARLRQLDKRYRTKYAMSMIENLTAMREWGLEAFVENEKKRWRCARCGHVLCVHRANCLYCGASWRLASPTLRKLQTD